MLYLAHLTRVFPPDRAGTAQATPVPTYITDHDYHNPSKNKILNMHCLNKKKILSETQYVMTA